jgi:hypothetical protein
VGGHDVFCQISELLVFALGGAAEDIERLVGTASFLGHEDAFGLLDNREGGQSSLEVFNQGVPGTRARGGNNLHVLQSGLDQFGGP